MDEEVEEEEKGEEMDDSGNLWTRGREMKMRRGNRGGGVPGVPLTAVWSVAVSSCCVF